MFDAARGERQSGLLEQITCPSSDIFMEALFGSQNGPDCHDDLLDCHFVGDVVEVGGYVKEEEELGCKDFRRAIVCLLQRDNRALT